MIQVEHFSTAGLKASERLACWNEVVLSRIGPIAVEAPERCEFSATLECFQFSDLQILSPTSGASISRNRASDADPGVLNLMLQHAGRSWNSTLGRTSIVERGDFILYDPTRALELRTTAPTQMIIVRMPMARIEDKVPGLQNMVGIPVRGSSGGGAIVSSFLRRAWTEFKSEGGGEWVQALADAFWAVLPLAYTSDSLIAREAGRRHRRWREVQAIVDRMLGESQFGAREIAGRLGVSVRYVQMMFAGMATTPSAYIQRRRVQLAGEMLRRHGRRMSITDVAFEVGFADASSFCRAFRRLYRTTPRDYRAGIRPDGTQLPERPSAPNAEWESRTRAHG
jgi:AraC family transcriptional regulator, positive regulator of tynA and feaB